MVRAGGECVRELLRDGSSPGSAQRLCGFSQPGHQLQRPRQWHAGRRCLQCHGAAHLPPPARHHGHGHTDEAVQKLLGIGGIAWSQDLLQLGLQCGAVGRGERLPETSRFFPLQTICAVMP